MKKEKINIKKSFQDSTHSSTTDLEVDESEAFGLACVLVLGQEDATDVSKGPEQILQILLPSVLRQVGHTHRRSLIWE